MQRREFLTNSLAAGAALVVGSKAAFQASTALADDAPAAGGAPFKQPALPYSLGALAPFLKAEQMDYHYNKHHAAYFKKLNGLVGGTPQAKLSLEDLIVQADGPVFNNAAQAWNHTFFWQCMAPNGGGQPTGDLAQAITDNFGSFDAFQKAFSDQAAALFGSGWTWLAVTGDGKLEIKQLANADTPLRHGWTPVLTLDVWEHAYYIDYRNDRAAFIKGFWSKANWAFASTSFAQSAS